MFPPILKKIFKKKIILSQHLLLYCYDNDLLKEVLKTITQYPFKRITHKNTSYLNYESLYLFDFKKCKEDKCDLLSIIDNISLTKEYFTDNQYKYIFLNNFQESNEYFQKGLKSYLDKYSVIFILLCSEFSKIQKYILSHVIQVRIPIPTIIRENSLLVNDQLNRAKDKLEMIIGKEIILSKDALVQKQIGIYKEEITNKERIKKIKDLSYEFLISGYPLSEYLQKVLVIILKNLIIPISVKEKCVKDISFCETLNEKCFRKGVIIEYTFLKIYDNLKYYTHYL